MEMPDKKSLAYSLLETLYGLEAIYVNGEATDIDRLAELMLSIGYNKGQLQCFISRLESNGYIEFTASGYLLTLGVSRHFKAKETGIAIEATIPSREARPFRPLTGYMERMYGWIRPGSLDEKRPRSFYVSGTSINPELNKP